MASGIRRVVALQRTAGNRATVALLMRENGDDDAPGGVVTTEAAAAPQKGAARKDVLDGAMKNLLDDAAAAVGPPGQTETPVKWAQRVLRRVKSENPTKLIEFKTNVLEKYVKELGYAAGHLEKETRATLDPDAISNPGFTAEEKREIVHFLKTRNGGSPTVRVDEVIAAGEWSIMLHYDLLGPPHGVEQTPHVQFLKGDTTKSGIRYVGDHTRAMTFVETRTLMDHPDKNPSWAVDWAKQQVGAS